MKEPAFFVVNAQLYGMLGSLVVFTLVALWYLTPWLRRLPTKSALTVLLWVNVPRYVTLILYSAQRDGYPISNSAAFEAVVGDVAGALIALAAIAALRCYFKAGIWLSWLLVVETTADMIVGIVRKAHEPLWGKAGGVTWLILDVYIPMILIVLVLLVRQLISDKRR